MCPWRGRSRGGNNVKWRIFHHMGGVGWSLKTLPYSHGQAMVFNGKSFSKISKPTERNGAIRFPVIVLGWWETGNWKVKQFEGKFPLFHFEWKKRTTSIWRKSTISERISRKITVPLTFNRNFRISFLNGKHPKREPFLIWDFKHFALFRQLKKK